MSLGVTRVTVTRCRHVHPCVSIQPCAWRTEEDWPALKLGYVWGSQTTADFGTHSFLQCFTVPLHKTEGSIQRWSLHEEMSWRCDMTNQPQKLSQALSKFLDTPSHAAGWLHTLAKAVNHRACIDHCWVTRNVQNSPSIHKARRNVLELLSTHRQAARE
jgi:hypothetical protein